VDWGAERNMGVGRRLTPPVDESGVGVWQDSLAKAELNNTVHLCSNQGFTADFTPK
jgi:hypothetical protein